jgi:hypothetical protein
MRVVDIALTHDDAEGTIAHRADCPEVRQLAKEGKVVTTMLGCRKPLPPELKRHSCLPPATSKEPRHA